MGEFQTAERILGQEFLPMRAKILEIAASLDRIDRAEGEAVGIELEKLQTALRILLEAKGDRAEQVQLLFSLDYQETWREDLEL